MFAKFSVVAFGLLATIAGVSHAAPLDVYTPPLLEPAEGDVWQIGSQQLVKWDVSDPPAQITNRSGTIFLSQNGILLDYDHPLAEGFDILDGEHWVTVPNVPAACDYAIVLMGDSGNAGPNFCIESEY